MTVHEKRWRDVIYREGYKARSSVQFSKEVHGPLDVWCSLLLLLPTDVPFLSVELGESGEMCNSSLEAITEHAA